MRLKDKVALITGGSRGIGFATADRFLQEGAVVILTASSQGSADRAVAQLKEKHPSGTVAGPDGVSRGYLGLWMHRYSGEQRRGVGEHPLHGVHRGDL